MKQAALGFRMHSGWGVVVALTGDTDTVEILRREHLVVMDGTLPGAKQPYHHVASLGLQEAERHLEKCATASEGLAVAAIELVLQELDANHYRIAGAAVLTASGRPLPALPKILASHPVIHTAEGEFFRSVIRNACERLKIAVEVIPERKLEERVKAAFGNSASRMQRSVASAGRSIGAPWTKDHKAAALAAWTVLLSPNPPARLAL